MTDASFARRRKSRRGASGATRRFAFLREAHLLTGDVDQASALFAESATLAAAMGNTDSFVDSEAELRIVGDGSRAVGGCGRARGTGTRRYRSVSDA